MRTQCTMLFFFTLILHWMRSHTNTEEKDMPSEAQVRAQKHYCTTIVAFIPR